LTTEEDVMAGRLAGEVAIITGAAQGVGKGIAAVMAAEGARVVLFDISDTVEAAAADLRKGQAMSDREVMALHVDITKPAEVREAAETVLNVHGRIDILVNNAAVLYFAPFPEATDEIIDRTLDVNFKGMWNCAKAVVPAMIEAKHGRIINMSSAAAITSSKGLTAYSASKGAICAFTRALALDLAEFGINVNSIIPCYVETEGLKDVAVSMGTTPKAYLAAIGKTVPLGRLASTEEIGDLAVFLASRSSKYITGQEIVIDGGNLIQTKKGDF
jgi:NAD(P)-dependent dehydrogenase (short-subunit alcohol dehydrogenase family)